MDQLQLTKSLFSALADAGVPYVHWKSNEHLTAALRGQTDLDLLIRREDRQAFSSILGRLDFIDMEAARSRQIDGISGHLGFDSSSGSLVQLDVYDRLILGERYTKNHHLPVEEWLLTDRGTLHGVAVPEPAREFLLLYVRALLKTSRRQMLRAARLGTSPLPDRILTEAVWLSTQVTDIGVDAAAASSGLPVTAEELEEFRTRLKEDTVHAGYVRRVRRSVLARLRPFERRGRQTAMRLRVWRRFRASRHRSVGELRYGRIYGVFVTPQPAS